MKKLVLAAGLLIAFAANAQYRQEGFRNDKIEYRQNDFGRLKLSPRQEREIFALSKQRLTAREYEAKLRRILSREQYAQYQRNDFRREEIPFNKPFRR